MFNVQCSMLNADPHSTFNIQHSTFNIQHSTFNIEHSTFPQSSVLSPQSSCLMPHASCLISWLIPFHSNIDNIDPSSSFFVADSGSSVRRSARFVGLVEYASAVSFETIP